MLKSQSDSLVLLRSAWNGRLRLASARIAQFSAKAVIVGTLRAASEPNRCLRFLLDNRTSSDVESFEPAGTFESPGGPNGRE